MQIKLLYKTKISSVIVKSFKSRSEKSMAPLPLFKLGALLAKQISKPLARLLKEKAVHNNFLKNYLLIPSANGKFYK